MELLASSSARSQTISTTCIPSSTQMLQYWRVKDLGTGCICCVSLICLLSRLANKKTVTIQPGKDQSVLLATTKTKKQNKPGRLLNKSLMKKEFHRMAKAVSNQVADNYYRPDLKKAALARLSVVHRSLKVAKSGVKKRNRQAA
ncbi:UNVERIFIED_CONTAM: 60S ribosomal protein L28-1 [Sesamum radiatum]|uniref:60S ribosomal protein L28-1 n=1 Tax=Sesamum radiatum TaxID=300843 RepID=A0AAW2VMA6_SESRA